MIEKGVAEGFLPTTSCWVITEAAIGMQNQAIGLAEALALPYVLKTVIRPKHFWQHLSLEDQGFVPPWPDLLISCGRLGAIVSRDIRKKSAGKTFTVHIQDPLIPPQYFDALIVPEHDKLRGDNVLVTRGAIHRVTPEKLIKGADQFRPLLASLPRPLICVLVGGKNRHQQFTSSTLYDFANKLIIAAKNTGGGLAITPSRRTGAENEKKLKQYIQGIPAFVWDGQGENPYFGMLSLADAIVVTSDSISMISEVCSTGKPVYVYDLPRAGKRHRHFLENLIRSGTARPFSGAIETWTYQPLKDTRQAADFVRDRFLARAQSMPAMQLEESCK
jgi:mitochondrial fission protein ELM1